MIPPGGRKKDDLISLYRVDRCYAQSTVPASYATASRQDNNVFLFWSLNLHKYLAVLVTLNQQSIFYDLQESPHF